MKLQIVVISIILITGCDSDAKKDIVNNGVYIDSMSEINNQLPIETLPTSSIDIQDKANSDELLLAFDKLYFRMSPEETKGLYTTKIKLGKFNYYLSPQFDENKELFLVKIHSLEIKTIQYETELQSRYNNLCRIISEKYGNQKACRSLPSIFEVMNAGTLYPNTWETGEKTIKLGVAQSKLDGFMVVCRIVHTKMEKLENERRHKKKNKDIIEASDKF